jgi:hypothetical protein
MFYVLKHNCIFAIYMKNNRAIISVYFKERNIFLNLFFSFYFSQIVIFSDILFFLPDRSWQNNSSPTMIIMKLDSNQYMGSRTTYSLHLRKSQFLELS